MLTTHTFQHLFTPAKHTLLARGIWPTNSISAALSGRFIVHQQEFTLWTWLSATLVIPWGSAPVCVALLPSSMLSEAASLWLSAIASLWLSEATSLWSTSKSWLSRWAYTKQQRRVKACGPWSHFGVLSCDLTDSFCWTCCGRQKLQVWSQQGLHAS